MRHERAHYRHFAWVLAAGLLLPPATFAQTGSPVGRWLTESGEGVIEIAPCGPGLCGRITGIARKPGEAVPTDVQGRSQCGLQIIDDEVQQGDGSWDGHITDPRTGHIWGATLRVTPQGDLVLRGYLGVSLLGSSQTWRPYKGTIGPDCRMETEEAGNGSTGGT